jgi:toxin ParE1/3/4
MRVRFTRAAQTDLQNIHAYIAEDNRHAADRVVRRLVDRALALAETPYAGREVDEPNARVVVIPRFRYFIFYTVAADEVHITHIRHTSRERPRWFRAE